MNKMTDRMNSIIGFVPKKKKQAKGAPHAIGGQIHKNVDQGQVNLKNGQVGMKGTHTAELDALKNGQVGMKGTHTAALAALLKNGQGR